MCLQNLPLDRHWQLTRDKKRFRSACKQQAGERRPAHCRRAAPALALHAACACEAPIQVQAAVMVWMHAIAHSLARDSQMSWTTSLCWTLFTDDR